MTKTVKNPSSKEKRVVGPSRALTAQNKKALECILGLCSHKEGAKGCLYWKFVDADDPARAQFDLIIKLMKGRKS